MSNNTTSNNTTSNNTSNNVSSINVTEELWGLLCDSTFECPTPDLLAFIGRFPSAAACKAAGPPEFVGLPAFDQAIANGNATFDEAKAATCLAKWSDSICELSFAVPPAECDDVFVGQLGESATCIECECAPGLECQTEGNACQGTCEKDCGEFSCGADEYCTDTGCVTRGAIGDLCQDFDECARGSFCINGECANGNSTPEGGDCQLAGECVGDLVCVDGVCSNFSTAKRGQPCQIGEVSIFCEPGTVCSGLTLGEAALEGTCGDPVGDGAPCRFFYECAIGLKCSATDPLTPGTCVALGGLGSACTTPFDCSEGVCENDVCTSNACQ